MADLVGLATGKAHLGITVSDYDTDIGVKIAQASDIIRSYLKDRFTAIASVSAANPAVVTTSVPHSLISGVSYTLADTTTTPTINGAQAVTVTGRTTFTVPVNVTAGQTSAAGTVSTPVLNETNAPARIQSAVLLMLTHLHEHRGDDDMAIDAALWEAIRRLLERDRDPALA